jgi:hypothetical protein
MRLATGGIREQHRHRHRAAEWTVTTNGSCRVTAWETAGRPYAGWLAHTPPALVECHLDLSASDIDKFPNNIPDVIPYDMSYDAPPATPVTFGSITDA